MDDTRSMSTTSSGGGKRKRGGPAFYAVKVGRQPDIYMTWDDAQAQINGFPHAVYKKFSSLAAAEEFMRTGTASPKPGKQKYYAVQIGHKPGVYTDWASAQAQITGCKRPVHRAFATAEEARQFIETGKAQSEPTSLRGDVESEASTVDARKGCKVGDNAPKKQKNNDSSAVVPVINGEFVPGTGPLPADAEDGFDPRITYETKNGEVRNKTEDELNARKLQPTGNFGGPLVIHTDGATLGNGKIGAVGGVGVFFGVDDARNVSEPLVGAPDQQTNQRAELTAISRALDIAPIDRDVIIRSDSRYAINCLTVWFDSWRENNKWKTSTGADVKNRDLIEPILARINERFLAKAKTNFEWVKGHNNDPGNTAADFLATNGAKEAKEGVKKLVGD